MVSVAAQIGDTAWYLVAMPDGSGQCDHCGRNLKHLYRVVNPASEELTVGRGCVKRLTGWTLATAEAKRLLWLAERDARRADVWAGFTEECPEWAQTITDDIAAFERTMPTSVGAGASHGIRDLIVDTGLTGSSRDRSVAQYMARRGEFCWVV